VHVIPEDGCSIVRIECLVSEVGDQGHLVRRENTMGGYSRLEGPSTDRAYPNMIEEVRFAPDSALEGAGFEPSVPHTKSHAFPGREAGLRST
jgi:hypothetical protein